jgi:hypothetical protein
MGEESNHVAGSLNLPRDGKLHAVRLHYDLKIRFRFGCWSAGPFAQLTAAKPDDRSIATVDGAIRRSKPVIAAMPTPMRTVPNSLFAATHEGRQ